MSDYEIRKVEDGFAVEVIGLDLARPLAAADLARLREAWFGAGVMVVRDQHLTPAQQVAFSRRFGALTRHVLAQFLLPEQPEILVLSNRKRADGTPVGFEDAGRYWHSDVSYGERPPLGSMLYAVEIPPEGGDTLFVDMVAALVALPAELRARIEGRRAVHSYTRNYERNRTVKGAPALTEVQRAAVPDVLHPIVRSVGDTGRQSLYVNPGFAVAAEGLPEDEGAALLQALFAHATGGDFLYRHRWRPHDLLCWDNRAVMHHATPYDPAYARHMHRTTISGPRPS